VTSLPAHTALAVVDTHVCASRVPACLCSKNSTNTRRGKVTSNVPFIRNPRGRYLASSPARYCPMQCIEPRVVCLHSDAVQGDRRSRTKQEEGHGRSAHYVEPAVKPHLSGSIVAMYMPAGFP
jgi:hypothetical protein